MSESKKNDGGSAFPNQGWWTNNHEHQPQGGMSLLDHFAGLAMQAIVMNDTISRGPISAEHSEEFFSRTSLCAYKFATSMLKARGEV